jgi:endoribonuclease L-PSP
MMFKKHAFKFIAFLVFLIAAITGYLFYSLTIFSPVNIHFSTTPNLTYHPIKKQDELMCYQVEQPLPEITQKTFRLLVWNLHKGQDAGWQQALNRLSQGRDLLLLQEVLNTQELAEQYSSRFPTALYASAFAYLQKQSGVEILSQFAPRFYCAGAKSEPWIRIPKVGAAMSLPLPNGQALLLVNVHLINFEMYPTAYEEQLRTLMQLVAQHQGPLVLSGDFNSWNGYRAQIIRKVINEFGLEEVSFEQDHRLRFLGNPLDHVFVRGLNVLHATTEPTESSDHAPLLLDVELAD